MPSRARLSGPVATLVADATKNDLRFLNIRREVGIWQEAGFAPLKARDVENPLTAAADEVVVPGVGIFIQSCTRPDIGDHENPAVGEIAYHLEHGAPRHSITPIDQELVHLVR